MPFPKMLNYHEVPEFDANKQPTGRMEVKMSLELKFERSRFNNPTGRILGPGGATMKWLRRHTSCDIFIPTNDIRFLKTDGRVEIGYFSVDVIEARTKVLYAARLIARITDSSNPQASYMSDYQLFQAGQAASRSDWFPEGFDTTVPVYPSLLGAQQPVPAPAQVATSDGPSTSRTPTSTELSSSSATNMASQAARSNNFSGQDARSTLPSVSIYGNSGSRGNTFTRTGLNLPSSPLPGSIHGPWIVPNQYQVGVPVVSNFYGVHPYLPALMAPVNYTRAPVPNLQSPFFNQVAPWSGNGFQGFW